MKIKTLFWTGLKFIPRSIYKSYKTYKEKIYKSIFYIFFILLACGIIYLLYPKYYFVVGDGVPYVKCNKITGKCNLTDLGERLLKAKNK